MPDLVDYLRDKLAHADDVVCTCGTVDVTAVTDPEPVMVRGRTNPRCPLHGYASGFVGFRTLEISSVLPNDWRCTNCWATGNTVDSGLDHLGAQHYSYADAKVVCPPRQMSVHRTKYIPPSERRKRWWRR